MKILDPLQQFQVHVLYPLYLWGIDISWNNAALSMVFSVTILLLLLYIGALKPQSLLGHSVRHFYKFMEKIADDMIGPQGRVHLPFLSTLFVLVAAGNLWGVLPYAFTFTSHLASTFTLAFVVIVYAIILGFYKHGLGFFHLFLPSGVPYWMAPLLVPLELFSYAMRPVSLGVRLFVNMMAGHTMMKIFLGFAAIIGSWGVLPLGLHVVISAFEIFVSLLQAYVFVVLTCLYLRDSIELH